VDIHVHVMEFLRKVTKLVTHATSRLSISLNAGRNKLWHVP
jgi:hypothetical protein